MKQHFTLYLTRKIPAFFELISKAAKIKQSTIATYITDLIIRDLFNLKLLKEEKVNFVSTGDNQLDTIKRSLMANKTYAEIGDILGLSRQRVQQIVKKHNLVTGTWANRKLNYDVWKRKEGK